MYQPDKHLGSNRSPRATPAQREAAYYWRLYPAVATKYAPELEALERRAAEFRAVKDQVVARDIERDIAILVRMARRDALELIVHRPSSQRGAVTAKRRR